MNATVAFIAWPTVLQAEKLLCEQENTRGNSNGESERVIDRKTDIFL